MLKEKTLLFLPFSPGLILSAPCAFAVGFLDCTQIVIVVVCLCGWLGFAGFCRSGNAILQIEMAPRLGNFELESFVENDQLERCGLFTLTMAESVQRSL